jgi:protoporphyrinogen oxidase
VQILKSGGLGYAVRAASDFMVAKLKHRDGTTASDFGAFSNSWFGKTIANTFLIPFSEKLWGLPAADLSPDIAGSRLPGFSIKAIIKELLSGARKVEHLEGRFLYPQLGYGQIADKMAHRLADGRLLYRHRAVHMETRNDEVIAVGVKGRGDSTDCARRGNKHPAYNPAGTNDEPHASPGSPGCSLKAALPGCGAGGIVY